MLAFPAYIPRTAIGSHAMTVFRQAGAVYDEGHLRREPGSRAAGGRNGRRPIPGVGFLFQPVALDWDISSWNVCFGALYFEWVSARDCLTGRTA